MLKGKVFTDTRDNTDWVITEVLPNNRGTLYTVQNLYDRSQYKRHYKTKLKQIGRSFRDETLETKTDLTGAYKGTLIDDSNVIFMDFKSQTKISNRDTWLNFYGLTKKTV